MKQHAAGLGLACLHLLLLLPPVAIAASLMLQFPQLRALELMQVCHHLQQQHQTVLHGHACVSLRVGGFLA
jgi:hypothetical protein